MGLDPQSRLSLWDLIRRLNQSFEVTVFLTTHYLDEADRLAQRVGIVDQGRIRVIGSPESLKDEIKGDSVNLSFERLNGSQKQMVSSLKAEPFVKELLEEEKGVRVYVANGGEAIPLILKSLQSKSLEVKSVTISRPSLDDVFLKYTGKRMDQEESSGDQNPWWAKWQKGGGSWGAQKGKWETDEGSQQKEGGWEEQKKKWDTENGSSTQGGSWEDQKGKWESSEASPQKKVEWGSDSSEWKRSQKWEQKGEWPAQDQSWGSQESGDESKKQEVKNHWKTEDQ